jgi:hypothetical protein
MTRKNFVVFVLALGFFSMFSRPALANDLSGASATVDCSGFTLNVDVVKLTVGASYTINFTFTLTPTSGSPITVPGTINFVASSTTATKTASGTWPNSPLAANYTVTGSAVLTTSGSLVPITFNGASSVELTCGGTGCPATPGFWKNEKKHPFPDSVQTSGLKIGGVTYSAADLLTILNNNGGNAVAILGRQLVAALLNLSAGAKHNVTADGAITTAEALLKANNLNLLTSEVDPSTALGQALLAPADVLDKYNNANFHSCSEGSGLIFGH